MTLDREDLQGWYRGAMVRRLDELRGFREGLRAGESSTFDAARAVAEALRGSGATFGYPDLSAVAGLVESADDSAVLRRNEGLIEHVRRLAAGTETDGAIGAEWLSLAAGEQGSDTEVFSDLGAAWQRASQQHGLDADQLAARVAELFGLERADLSEPSRAALRLVPEALIHSSGVLPLRQDSETITVATADPTSLALEIELARLTGRSPIFSVAQPDALRRAIAGVLDDASAPAVVAAGPPPDRVRESRPDQDRVLIVDDEPAARLLARTVLEKGGYSVEEAGDGLEALDRLGASDPVALIVADLNMPRLDGLELIWELRATERWSHIPVIVVTGETDEILETKLIEEGADDYIHKPLDPRLFLARVAATIRRAEL